MNKSTKHLLAVIAASAIGLTAKAQPELNSWIMNTNGQLGTYIQQQGPNQATVNMNDSVNVLRVCYTGTNVYVRAHGLAGYVMGPWTGNPNVPSAQNEIFRIRRNPQQQTATKTAVPLVGGVGLSVNGIKFYGTGDSRSYSSASNSNVANGDGLWHGDAWTSEGTTMDATGKGHADQGGNYHYHATPIALYSDPSTTHSPIIGFAFDGFPIYGSFGYSNPMSSSSAIARIESSYQLRNITTRTILPDGSTSSPPGPNVSSSFPLGTYMEDYEYISGLGDLDEYNGRYCVTPEYPSGTYAYFVTTKSNGDPAFPYLLAYEYYGIVSNSDIGPNAGNATIPSTGVTCFTSITTGVEETASSSNISVYPNPATGNITIETGNEVSITIANVMGQTMMSRQLGASSETISISNMSAGVYFMTITYSSGRTETVRIVKQ